MQNFKTLTLAGLIGGMMLASGAANAHVTYNTTGNGNAAGGSPTDGTQTGPWSAGDPGYTGNLPATWVAQIHNDGGVANSQTASSAGAGFTIGLGAKAYRDGSTNWGMTADFGLINLHHDADVTITVSSDGSDLRPAFGLWQGWDSSTSGSRHDSYTSNGAILPGAAAPLSSDIGSFLGWAAAASQGTSASATLSLFLSAGQYTLILGGYNGTTAGANLAYTATISAAAAPVPIPAAAWLFGSSVVGLLGFGRRKKSA